ncbi:MAG: MarR family transcriptional regulator [Clostridia bacterium]|nr:MarR family transcriptional regulator [Clostridia bacterium]
MDQEVVDTYLNKIPVQARELVQNLHTNEKWAVYAALLQNERMSFSELRDLFDMNPSQIDRVLKSLVAGGIIYKRAKSLKDGDDNARSYYELSMLGQNFYNAMFDLVIPPKRNAPPTYSMRSPEHSQAIPSPLNSVSNVRGGSQHSKSSAIRGAVKPRLPTAVGA